MIDNGIPVRHDLPEHLDVLRLRADAVHAGGQLHPLLDRAPVVLKVLAELSQDPVGLHLEGRDLHHLLQSPGRLRLLPQLDSELGFLGVDDTTGQDQLHRGISPDGARQAEEAAGAGDQVALGLGQLGLTSSRDFEYVAQARALSEQCVRFDCTVERSLEPGRR